MEIVHRRDPRSGKQRPQERAFNPRRAVRVLPRDENIRKYIKHGVTKVGWQAEGSCEWPFDAFTRNRLRDGDVTIEVAEDRALPKPENEKHEKSEKSDKEKSEKPEKADAKT
jgi:hypothetical protein